MKTALVIGTGLMGTSVALALRAHGATVHLRDTDSGAARTAASLGAGTVVPPEEPVELAVLAVPPALVAEVLSDVQAEGVARHCTDVASVKAGPRQDALALDCDTARYLGGHPMAGGERGGPLAARADLFEGCTWVLTPTADTGTDTLNTVLELVSACRAVPVVMAAEAHDRAVGLVSHVPHVVASLVAALLTRAEDREVRLAGPGVRDLTRIAGADPRLWVDILSANSLVVADLLESLSAGLEDAVGALRAMAATDEVKRDQGARDVEELLRRGVAGRARISGKHGVRATPYETVTIRIGDQPGELARLFTDVGRAGVNIEDVHLEHSTVQPTGLVRLSVAQGTAIGLEESLGARGWRRR